MSWLIENWFWVLIGIVFVGMHLFGHGGHGGHGGKGKNHKADHDASSEEKEPEDRKGDHRH